MLQHRGKAYWKMIVGNGAAGAEGWLPSDEAVLRVAQKEKLHGNNGIGYLSKRPPPFPSMNNIWVAFDGFFVDTEKLHLHPYIGLTLKLGKEISAYEARNPIAPPAHS